MRKVYYLLSLMLLSLSINFCTAQSAMIPAPARMLTNGHNFIINEKTIIYYDKQDGFLREANYLQSLLQKPTGLTLKVEPLKSLKKAKNAIILLADRSDSLGNEGYTLQTATNAIIIAARQSTGLFYGMQTLRQLLPLEIEALSQQAGIEWKVPGVQITDKPAFIWRGLNLDCCRHFMSVDFVKRYIDLLAFYKMNRLHWHLTDDQGWRIEIKKYPELVKTGAWRTEADGSRYGGYYTQDQIREVVAYAESRHVLVVPEIEMPGHSTAALASFPHLGCTGGPYKVETSWGVFRDIFCAGNDSTFVFLQNVLDEVITLFPSTYIHIGGDEAPHERWENCPKCKARMAAYGLKDGAELQSWFIKRIDKYLTEKGRKIIGWDEILDGGLAPGATVQSWRGFDGATAAALSGHDAIVSPTSHCYFDYGINNTSLAKVYEFDPVPANMELPLHKHILGGECNIWTEHVTQNLVDSRLFPRMLALSEVLWTYPQQRDFPAFKQRVDLHYPRLDRMGVTYGSEDQLLTMSSEYSASDKSFIITLNPGNKRQDIVYTTDGSDPTVNSTRYAGPFRITGSATVKARLLRSYGVDSELLQRSFVFHQGLGLAPRLKALFSNTYTAGGIKGTVDGVRATSNFKDGLWQGYQKVDLGLTLPLGERKKINNVTVTFMQNLASWIFLPEWVELSISENGIDFVPLKRISFSNTPDNKETILREVSFKDVCPAETYYIRISAKNVGTCPDWHWGAGGDAWIFIDEIIID